MFLSFVNPLRPIATGPVTGALRGRLRRTSDFFAAACAFAAGAGVLSAEIWAAERGFAAALALPAAFAGAVFADVVFDAAFAVLGLAAALADAAFAALDFAVAVFVGAFTAAGVSATACSPGAVAFAATAAGVFSDRGGSSLTRHCVSFRRMR